MQCDYCIRKKKPVRRHLKVHKKNKELLAKIQKLQMTLNCGICWEREKDIILDCGHSVCSHCWKRIRKPKKCPFDRKLASMQGKLFL